MKNQNEKKKAAVLWSAILATGAVAAALAMPAVPQDPSYHNFADSRVFLGIPNAPDVLSNLPLTVLGIAAIVLCRRKGGPDSIPGRMKIFFFATVLATGVGSSIYHWRPDNFSIIWDRIPLSVMFMALYLVFLADRVSAKAASLLVWPVLAAGPASVLYWYWSELQGAGDLRFYGVVKLLPLLLIPATIFIRPKGTVGNAPLWKGLAWYVSATVAEFLDGRIFRITGFISGHTLKHLFAGIAVFCLLSICHKNAVCPGSRNGGGGRHHSPDLRAGRG
ncbi:MAG: alkaline phytoceramidase [Acidobacteria bacterium]|nr:alkaline phytoceramidase [Acidobacteriota bacterium]